MLESHKLVSKYHSELLLFSNSCLDDSLQQREEVKNLRIQSFTHIKNSLKQLLPRIDQ